MSDEPKKKSFAEAMNRLKTLNKDIGSNKITARKPDKYETEGIMISPDAPGGVQQQVRNALLTGKRNEARDKGVPDDTSDKYLTDENLSTPLKVKETVEKEHILTKDGAIIPKSYLNNIRKSPEQGGFGIQLTDDDVRNMTQAKFKEFNDSLNANIERQNKGIEASNQAEQDKFDLASILTRGKAINGFDTNLRGSKISSDYGTEVAPEVNLPSPATPSDRSYIADTLLPDFDKMNDEDKRKALREANSKIADNTNIDEDTKKNLQQIIQNKKDEYVSSKNFPFYFDLLTKLPGSDKSKERYLGITESGPIAKSITGAFSPIVEGSNIINRALDLPEIEKPNYQAPEGVVNDALGFVSELGGSISNIELSGLAIGGIVGKFKPLADLVKKYPKLAGIVSTGLAFTIPSVPEELGKLQKGEQDLSTTGMHLAFDFGFGGLMAGNPYNKTYKTVLKELDAGLSKTDIAKLEKIYNLSVRGVRGEKITAEKMIEDYSKKSGLSMEEIKNLIDGKNTKITLSLDRSKWLKGLLYDITVLPAYSAATSYADTGEINKEQLLKDIALFAAFRMLHFGGKKTDYIRQEKPIPEPKQLTGKAGEQPIEPTKVVSPEMKETPEPLKTKEAQEFHNERIKPFDDNIAELQKALKTTTDKKQIKKIKDTIAKLEKEKQDALKENPIEGASPSAPEVENVNKNDVPVKKDAKTDDNQSALVNKKDPFTKEVLEGMLKTIDEGVKSKKITPEQGEKRRVEIKRALQELKNKEQLTTKLPALKDYLDKTVKDHYGDTVADSEEEYSSRMEEIQNKIDEKEKEHSELLAKNKGKKGFKNSPEVKAIESELQKLSDQAGQLEKSYISMAEDQYNQVKSEIEKRLKKLNVDPKSVDIDYIGSDVMDYVYGDLKESGWNQKITDIIDDAIKERVGELPESKQVEKPESKLKEEVVKPNVSDAKDIETVDYPDNFDKDNIHSSINNMIKDAFKQLGVDVTTNQAIKTNSVYYGIELSNGEKFKLRISDHANPGLNEKGSADATIIYNENSTPADIINELRYALPDDMIKNIPESSNKKLENSNETLTDLQPESKLKAEKPEKSYSSTQVDIPDAEKKPFIDYANSIPEKDLYHETSDAYDNYGRETEPHITALYGLHSNDSKQVEKLLKDFGDVEITLGKTSLFKNSDKPYDVLKVDVDSPDLHKINKLLKDNVEFTSDFPKYQPHLTIAYLKKGKGKKYSGDDRFEGKKIKLSELLFSNKDREKTVVKLSSEKSVEQPEVKPEKPNKNKKSVEDLITETPRGELPEFISEAIKSDAEQKLDHIEGAKKESVGSWITQDPITGESKGTSPFTVSGFPGWFSDLGSNKQSVITALQKIITDKGKDKGILVERLKGAILDHLKNGATEREMEGVTVVSGKSKRGDPNKIVIPPDEEIAEFLEQFKDEKLTLKQFNKKLKENEKDVSDFFKDKGKEKTPEQLPKKSEKPKVIKNKSTGDKELDDLWDEFDAKFQKDTALPGIKFQKDTSSDNENEKILFGNKIIKVYTGKGIYDLERILSDVYKKLGKEKYRDNFGFIKGAYASFMMSAEDSIADKMLPAADIRSLKMGELLNRLEEEEKLNSDKSQEIKNDTSTTSGLESDSGEQLEKPMGEKDVQPGSEGIEQGNEQGVKDNGSSKDPEQSDISIPPDISAFSGKPSDSDLFGSESKLPNGNTSGKLNTRGTKIGGSRIPSKRSTTDDTPQTFGEQFEQTRDIKQSDAEQQQQDAELIDSDKIADIENIRETLPYLLPSQHDDVLKAETRFFDKKNQTQERQFGKGILFTNATGTGKTLTGLGIAKRFVRRGKKNILIVVPTDTKAKDWIEEGEHLNLEVTQLTGVQDAGKGVSTTTYANYRQNEELLKRDFDLVIYDESHNIISGKGKETTASLNQHHQVVKTYKNAVQQALKEHPEISKKQKQIDKLEKLRENLEEKRRNLSYGSPQYKEISEELSSKYPEVHKLDAEIRELMETDGFKKLVGEITSRTKVIFLSASPFAYHDTAIYGDGTLFNIRQAPRKETSKSYNEPGEYERFFVENFGYRMRYNKLTVPGADVDVGLMEREFTEKLIKEGIISRKILDSDKDYSREFVLVNKGVGEIMDEAIDKLSDLTRPESNNPTEQEILTAEAWEMVYKAINSKFNYLYQAQLMEAIKAKEYVDRIKQHLAQGRKVVVFHSYNNALPGHPFKLTLEEVIGQVNGLAALTNPNKYAQLIGTIGNVYDDFQEDFAEAINLEMEDLRNPRELYANIFGNKAGFYNGLVPKKLRNANIKRFQDDNSGLDILVVQIQAGKEGISLHDITGNHQRVLIDLALPVRPTDAIQTEGRIFRIGNMSNAIFEYPIINTRFERRYFASTIAKRSKTAENLALGDLARDLEVAFKEGYLNPTEVGPGEHQGLGGKEADARLEVTDEYDRAKTYYFARQKRTSQQKSAEGVDYFATPEPLGLKMAEFMDLQPNEAALEPSAGHGAIARFFPITTTNTFVEPSRELFSQLGLNAAGEHNRLENSHFEDLNIINKYDGIATNPPFGKAGKTAIEHLKKDFIHLKNRGRIVAIIPRGSTDQKLQDFLESEEGENAYLRATINLPPSTFERAGTSVNTQLVIIDKVLNAEEISIPPVMQIDLSDTENIKDFFDRLKPIEVPERITAEQVREAESKNVTSEKNDLARQIDEELGKPFSADKKHTELTIQKHTQTGETIFVVKAKTRLDKNQYSFVNGLAKSKRGFYSRFARGFLFKDSATAKEFQNEADNYIENAVNPKPSFQKDTEPKNIGDLTVKLKSLESRKEKVLSQIEKVKALGKGEISEVKQDESYQPDMFGKVETQATLGLTSEVDSNKERLKKLNKELSIIEKEISSTQRDIDRKGNADGQLPMFQKDTTIQRVNNKATEFYSPLEKIIESAKQEKFNANDFLGWVKNQKGFRQNELEWIGLDKFLSGKKSVTKSELLDYVKANKVEARDAILEDEIKNVKLKWETSATGSETVIDENTGAELGIVKRIYDGGEYEWMPYFFDDENSYGESFEKLEDAKHYVEVKLNAEKRRLNNTKYSQYTLPGEKSNYREVLITLPTETSEIAKRRSELAGLDRERPLTDIEQTEYDELQKKGIKGTFKSSHYSEPNIVAHLRIDDRVSGKDNILFVEEMQSDWDLKGRKEEFGNTPESAIKRFGFTKEQWAEFTEDQKKSYIQEASLFNTPDMPFKGSKWTELAIKKAIQIAISEGKDGIAWINGEQTADRYDLSKQVANIKWSKSDSFRKRIMVATKDYQDIELTITDTGKVIDGPSRAMGKNLDEVISKEIAKKIIDSDKGKLEGLDLKIGGLWAYNLYDRQIPSIVKEYAKKLGGEVTEYDIRISSIEESDYTIFQTDTDNWEITLNGHYVDEYSSEQKAMDYVNSQMQTKKSSKQFGLKITPEMRKKVMSEGLPIFQKSETESHITALVDRLNELMESTHSVKGAFPNVEIVFLDNAGIIAKVKELYNVSHEKSDKAFYSPVDGKVYINIDKADSTSAAHEVAGHVFMQMLKTTNPKLYNTGLKIAMQDQDLVNQVIEDYPELEDDPEILADEVLAQATGMDFDEMFKNIKDKKERQTWIDRFKEWFKKVINNIKLRAKAFFKDQPEIINKINNLPENPTIKDWTNAIATDILEGRKVSDISSKELRGKKDTSFQKDTKPKRKTGTTSDDLTGGENIPSWKRLPKKKKAEVAPEESETENTEAQEIPEDEKPRPISSTRSIDLKKDSGFTWKQRLVFEILNRFEPFKRYSAESGVQDTMGDPTLDAFNFMNKNAIVTSWVKGKSIPVIQANGDFRLYKGTVTDYMNLVKGKEQEFDDYLVARRVVEDNEIVKRLADEIKTLKDEYKKEFDIYSNLKENELPGRTKQLKKIKEIETNINLRQNKLETKQSQIENDNFDLEDAIRITDQYKDEFNKPSTIYDNINKRLLDVMENTGLITEDRADELRKGKDYASFQRIMDDLETLGYSSNNPGTQLKSQKKRTGSQREIISPTYNQVKAITETIGKGLLNNIWNRLAKLAEKNPNLADRFYPDEKGELVFKIDGEQVTYSMPPEIDAIARTLRPKELDAFSELLQIPANIFTRLTTSANPMFAFGNLTVDQFSALMQTKTGFKPVVDPVKSLIEFLKKSNDFEKYLSTGGKHQTLAGYLELDPENLSKKLTHTSTGIDHAKNIVDTSLGILELPSNLSEIITRFSEFKRAKQSGKSDTEAMYMAAQVSIPFSLQGNFGGRYGRAFVKSIPYFNAGIQAMYKFVRSLKEQPLRVGSVAAGLIAGGIATVLATYLFGSNEQKRLLNNQPINELSKAIFIPSWNGKGLIRLRVPQEIGAFTGMIYLWAGSHIAKGNKAALSDYLEALENMLPTQVSVSDPSTLLMSWLPEIIKPSVEITTNKKTYPEVAPIVPEYMKNTKEPREQYTDYTSDVAKFIGDTFNWSPMLVDHWLKAQFGAVGNLIMSPNRYLSTFPLYRQEERFVLSGRANNNFYEEKENIAKQYEKTKTTKMPEQEVMNIVEADVMFDKVGEILADLREVLKTTGDLPENVKEKTFELLTSIQNNKAVGPHLADIEKLSDMTDSLKREAAVERERSPFKVADWNKYVNRRLTDENREKMGLPDAGIKGEKDIKKLFENNNLQKVDGKPYYYSPSDDEITTGKVDYSRIRELLENRLDKMQEYYDDKKISKETMEKQKSSLKKAIEEIKSLKLKK